MDRDAEITKQIRDYELQINEIKNIQRHFIEKHQ